MKKKIAEFIMQYIESSARKTAMSSKAFIGTKQLPDVLKKENSHG